MPNIGKLLKLGDKMLTNGVNKAKLGEAVRTYNKGGKQIEVFQKTKKVGFKGKERTFEYRFADNAETPFEISVTEKNKEGFARYTRNLEKNSKSLTRHKNEGQVFGAYEEGKNWHYSEKYDLDGNLIEINKRGIGDDGIHYNRTAIKEESGEIRVKQRLSNWNTETQKFDTKEQDYLSKFDLSLHSDICTFNPKAYANNLFLNNKVTGSIATVIVGALLGMLIWGTKELINGNSTNNDEVTADVSETTDNNESSQAAEPEAPAEKTDETEVAQEEEPTTSNEGSESTAVVEQPSQPQRGTAEEGTNSQQTTVAAQNDSKDSSATVNTSERQNNKQRSEETQTNPQTTTVQAEENEEPANIDKNNLFNGEIKEITNASVVVVKGDCLWNIAKRELRAANPDKVITNAQILKQVKEFGRLNPEIVDLNLIYPDQTIKLRA